MKRFTAKIKEKGNDHILTPEYWGDDFTTKKMVEDFWGCHNDDVEWFEITEEPLVQQ